MESRSYGQASCGGSFADGASGRAGMGPPERRRQHRQRTVAKIEGTYHYNPTGKADPFKLLSMWELAQKKAVEQSRPLL